MSITGNVPARKELELDGLAEAIRQELVKSAEPLIQKALADFEKEARKKVGQVCLAVIERDYDMRRHGIDLVIHVKGVFKPDTRL
jgi:hypothetical protein